MTSKSLTRSISLALLVAITAISVITLNPGKIAAQVVILPPDPLMEPPIETVPDDPELDPIRFKVSVGPSYVGFLGGAQSGAMVLQPSVWFMVSQHCGIELAGSIGYSKFDFSDDGDWVDTITMKGLLQVGYRSYGDEFQILFGVGASDVRDMNNDIGITGFAISVATRYQPWEHFGFEARYTGGPSWVDSTDELFYGHELFVGGYFAF